MTSRQICSTLASLMSQYDISEVIVSPGSRNAVIIEALHKSGNFNLVPVIDERSAAFIALGHAMISNKCVALVCTSGSALLNYGPAIAEACYRRLPLLIISADRPHEIIDRNDGQTIVQPDAFSNLIEKSYNISHNESNEYINLLLNEAMNSATKPAALPVHINVEIADPSLTTEYEVEVPETKKIEFFNNSYLLPQEQIKQLAGELSSPRRVMVVAGGMQPSQRLSKALSKLCGFGNWIVLADNVANLHGRGIVTGLFSVCSHESLKHKPGIFPDLVITIGCPIISSHLKDFIKYIDCEHWHLGVEERAQDTFGKLKKSITAVPEVFFAQLIANIRRNNSVSTFTNDWLKLAQSAYSEAKQYVATTKWSDIKALTTILSSTPRSCNVQLSNGLTSRYAQVLPFDFHRVDCNRGVSGIDGSTSTAIGAAQAFEGTTLLVTGDMSAQYDIGCLTTGQVPSNLKIVLMDNGGGTIFNFIKGTRSSSITADYLAISHQYNVDKIAASAGIKVFYASNEVELRTELKHFFQHNFEPAMLVVKTDSNESAQVFTEFLKRNKK